MRRKHKVVRKATVADDKKLMSTLKRMQLTPIPGIEEVTMFKDDGKVLYFKEPKVQAALGGNTFVIHGAADEKSYAEMLPQLLGYGGGDLNALKKVAEQLAKLKGTGAKAAGEEDEAAGIDSFDGDA